MKAGLELLYLAGVHRLQRSPLRGIGAILTFHRVRPPRPDAFQPWAGLEVTPEFLDVAVTTLREADVDIVSIGEAHRRLACGPAGRRFAVLTFDDGYRDNMEYAWPVLRRHRAPFTIYGVSAFADGTGTLWWRVLEEAVGRGRTLELTLDDRRSYECTTLQDKKKAFAAIYGWLRSREHDSDRLRVIEEIARTCCIDPAAQCRNECMGWAEIGELAADPLVTIGAHTVSHPFLAKLDAASARSEMVESRKRLEEKLGVRVAHMAYPVGAPDAAGEREFRIAAEAGYETAVTTRRGVLFAEHQRHLTALPRIAINGEFQRARFVEVLMSGAPTALSNRFQHVDAG